MMKNWDGRYLIGLFLVLFILKGVIEFIWKGSHSFTLNEADFRLPIFLVFMNELFVIWENWSTFRFLFVIFLSDYLLDWIIDLLGAETITLTMLPYLILLGTLFLVLAIRDLYYKRPHELHNYV
jgi:hypothetical protein